jgi:hypothetical protein
MGTGVVFSIDFVENRLMVSSLSGVIASSALPGLSVAGLHARVMAALEVLGVPPEIRAVPFGLADSTPFAEDHAHSEYDPPAVLRYWQVLTGASLLLEQKAGHRSWHTMDMPSRALSNRRARSRHRHRHRRRHVGGLLARGHQRRLLVRGRRRSAPASCSYSTRSRKALPRPPRAQLGAVNPKP